MKPDNHPTARAPIDDVERAHLVDPTDTSVTIGRWEPSTPGLNELIRRFWVPVWSVPDGGERTQQVLQYPICLIVVSDDYARFYGVVSGLSEVTLADDGWAVGVMLMPAAGGLLTGRSVDEWTDRHVELDEVFGSSGTALAGRIRDVMRPDPADPAAQHAATDLYEAWMVPFIPIDDDGRLVNEIVEYVENSTDVVAVGQICARFHLTERSLQRLIRRRLGLTPKWLIQRRRLHEAAGRLRDSGVTLATIAAELGYADESHLVRDFRTVTGMTPGSFAARFDDRR